MTVKHHINDELILAYGTGGTDEATSLLIATHLALCPICRKVLDAAECLGGAMLEIAAEAEVGDADLQAVLDRVDRTAAPIKASAPIAETRSFVLPQPLRDYVKGDVDELRWRRLGGGVRHLLVDTGLSPVQARLLNVPAGAKVPDHGHHGLELTLVLSGSFYSRGVWFKRGDVEEADATIEHQPTAGPEEPCICLAVTDAPLRFRSIIPRLAQRFIGI